MRADVSYKLEDEIRQAPDRIALVRCWEDGQALRAQLSETFPDRKIDILKPSEALAASKKYSLLAVLQADALFDKSDFRSDEKALQTLVRLSLKADRIVLQTARASHPVFAMLRGAAGEEALLAERKDFNLPPFTRMVDTVIRDSNPARLKKFASIVSRSQPDAARLEGEDCVRFRTTLPRTGEASGRKHQMALSIRYIEKEYNYSGHIHFDVDPA